MQILRTRLIAALAPLSLIWRPFLARPWRIALGVACAIGAALALLTLPVLAGDVLDAATAGSERQVVVGSATFGAAAILEAVLRYAARRLLIGESRRAEEALKQRLERRLIRLPIPWFDSVRTGDVISRMSQDVEVVRFTTGPALLYGTQALVVAPGGVAILVATSPWLALVAAAALGTMALAMLRLGPSLRRRSRAVQDALGEVAQLAAEGLSALRLLQAAHRITAEQRRMEARARRHRDAGVALARLQARVDLVIHASVETVLLAGLALGALAMLRHGATTGDLLEFYALLGIQLAPLLALGFVLGGLPRALGAAERVAELIAESPEPQGGISDLGTGPGRIELRGLSYAHPLGARPALRDVSFVIEPGTTVGLVGAVGSGKSTLMSLLLRFDDPPRGTILIDGEDVLDLDPIALRKRFAVALQDPFVFDETIEENVRFGLDGADAVAAARDAGLEPDVTTFPLGLDTVVGERGVTLSGGQRQRVALARALAAERPVLLLDDTLSAVDQETERRILRSLRRRRAGRTAVIATHRLSAVRDADRIVFLLSGTVAGVGAHRELLASCPPYAAAWRLQRESEALEGGLT